MPEICRVLQENKIWIISASGWLFKKKSIMMHGNMNVKFSTVHSALVSFMQVLMTKQNQDGTRSILTLLGSGHQKPA